MATSWPLVPLGTVVKNLDSKRIPLSAAQRRARPGSFPYYGATGVMDSVDDFLFEGLHLLVAEDGSVEDALGRPIRQLVSGQFWVNNHAHVLRGRNDLDTKYIYYALGTVNIRPFVSGSVQAKLSQRNMNRVPVPYPSDAKTRSGIVEVLGALDDKIDVNRRMSETLEQIARTHFDQWCIGQAKVDANGTLADVAVEHKAKWSPTDEKLVDHYSLPAFDAGMQPVREPGDSIKSTKTIVPKDAVLVSRLNPRIPRVWLTDVRDDVLSVASTEFLVATPKAPYGRSFLYMVASSGGFQQELISMATGTSGSHQRVRPAALFSVPVPTAPEPDLVRLEGLLGPLLSRILVARRENITLAQLRDALLPKLISGEIRVPEAEQLVSEVA